MDHKPHVNMFADLQVRYAANFTTEEGESNADSINNSICQACRKKLKEPPGSNQQIQLPKYFCGYCHRKLQHKHSLWMHLIHHTASMQRPPYTCPLCNKVFDTLSGYKLHLGSLHGVKPSNDCPHCPVKFIDRRMFEQHLNLHRVDVEKDTTRNTKQPNPVTHLLEFHRSIVCVDCFARLQHLCNLCQEMFNRKEELRHHLLDVHFHCPLCGSCFVKKREVFNHLKKFHNNTQLENCDVCSSLMVDVEEPPCKVRTRPKSNAEAELLEKIGKKVFKCHTCKTYFLSEDERVQETQANKRKFCKHCHYPDNKKRRKIHNESDGKLECNECDQQFETLDEIKKHMKIHYQSSSSEKEFPDYEEEEEEIYFACNVCGLEYGSQAILDLHIKANHHYCMYCCVAFHEKSHLILHVMTTHQENHPVICDCCRQAYLTMYQTDLDEAKKQANGIQFIAPPTEEGNVDMAKSTF